VQRRPVARGVCCFGRPDAAAAEPTPGLQVGELVRVVRGAAAPGANPNGTQIVVLLLSSRQLPRLVRRGRLHREQLDLLLACVLAARSHLLGGARRHADRDTPLGALRPPPAADDRVDGVGQAGGERRGGNEADEADGEQRRQREHDHNDA